MNALQLGESLSLVLIDAAAKGTVLLVGACLATILLRRSSAAVRHRVWGLAMGGLVLLPALSWLLPTWQLPILPAQTEQENPRVVESEAEPERQLLRRDRKTQPSNDDIAFAHAPATTDLRSVPVDTHSLVSSPTVPQSSAATVPIDGESSSATWVLLSAAILWSLGSSLFLAGVAVAIRRAGRLWRGSQTITDEAWGRLARELCSRLGLRRPVHLREHAEPVVPLTWGLLRPIILLPEQARIWPDSMRRAVLLHELAHVYRGDVAYQLLGRIACALYWFHPLAWFGLHQLRQEREHACDDAVIGSGERASDYAEQLLEVARRYRRAGRLALAVEITHGGSLEQRVRALFDAARSHAPVGRSLAMSLVAVTAVFVTAIAILRPVAAESQADAATAEDVTDAPPAAAAVDLSPKGATDKPTDKIDHLQQFKLEIGRAKRLVAAKKRADALQSLKVARRELALVQDADLLSVERTGHGEDAARFRSFKEWDLVLVFLSAGGLEDAIEITSGMRSPGFQADALSTIAVKLGAQGQRDTAIEYVDRALAAALKEKVIPKEFAHLWGYQEATWRFMALEEVGAACDTLGDTERTDRVIRLMQTERGQKVDAFELLVTVALRQQRRADEPGLQRTLDRMRDACADAEEAADNIASFWNKACSGMMEAGKFDEVASHLDKLSDDDRDRVRAGLVHGWSRDNQLERAAAESKHISEPSSRAVAMIFLARAEAAAGRKEAATGMRAAAIELVRLDKSFYVRAEPLLLAAETLAQWGDYAAAEREVTELNATITPETHRFSENYEGPRSDYFELPFQLGFGPQTGWLLIARAQLRAGKIDDAITMIDRIVELPGEGNIREWYRSFIFANAARELLRLGDRDRVQKLLSNEPNAAVRLAIEAELTAAGTEAAANAPRAGADQSQSPSTDPKKAAADAPSSTAATAKRGDNVDHSKRFNDNMTRARQLVFLAKQQDALLLLEEATRELSLVSDEQLLTADPLNGDLRRFGNDADRIRSGSQEQLIDCLLTAGGLDQAVKLVNEIRSPSIQAEALAEIAVQLAARGQRDTAIRYLDRALTAAPKERAIPAEFAKFWGDQEATWQLMGLLAVGDACQQIGEFDRYGQVLKLMQNARGKKGDALSLLLRVAHRQWERKDEPGMQQTLAQINEASENTESATEIIASFWNDVCSDLLEKGKFDDVVPHLDQLDDDARNRQRAGLVRGWARSNQMARATAELKHISEPRSRAIAMIFLARAEAAAGEKEAASKLLTEATELVRVETNPFVKTGPLVLAVETLALWGDYAAAERDAKQIDATIPPDAWVYSLYNGSRSDYFEMPFQILVGPQTSWLLIARAQVRAGKIDEAIKTIDRIADMPGARFMVDRYRGYIFGLVARELLRTGDRDRVQKLLASETIAAVREAIETDLAAVDSEPPAKAAIESKPESAAEILQKVIDKNKSWLDPRPKSLSYTLTGGKPGPGAKDEMVHHVWISGRNVRWEMDASPTAQNYTTIIMPEKTVWLRPPEARNNAMTDVSDTRCFRQGMTWQTAFHAIAQNGIPENCRMVATAQTKEGGDVVVEVDFDKARASVGLGLYQLYFGRANWRMDKVRLRIRLPDYLPLREEYLDPKTGTVRDTTVSFGPEYIQVGEHVAPKMMRYVQIQDEEMQKTSKFREWVLEGQFREFHGVWLLDKATNSQDGKIIRQMQVSEVSTAPIPAEKFDPTTRAED